MSRVGRYLLYEVAVLARVAGRYRIGRYMSYGVAVLARIAGRYKPYWPLFAACKGWSGQYRWPL